MKKYRQKSLHIRNMQMLTQWQFISIDNVYIYIWGLNRWSTCSTRTMWPEIDLVIVREQNFLQNKPKIKVQPDLVIPMSSFEF